MTTELELIHTIWDIVSAGTVNQDTKINERLMRTFLRIHRGKHLVRAYNSGIDLPDEVFQNLGFIPMNHSGGELVSSLNLPKIVRFNNNFGFMVEIGNYSVSVVDSEQYANSKKDKFNKHHPLAKMEGNKLHISRPTVRSCSNEDFIETDLDIAIKSIQPGYRAPKKGVVKMKAILVNPDDEPGYDFTRSLYPMSDELIEDLMTSVNQREFSIFLKTRGDEVGNSRFNTEEYDQ